MLKTVDTISNFFDMSNVNWKISKVKSVEERWSDEEKEVNGNVHSTYKFVLPLKGLWVG